MKKQEIENKIKEYKKNHNLENKEIVINIKVGDEERELIYRILQFCKLVFNKTERAKSIRLNYNSVYKTHILSIEDNKFCTIKELWLGNKNELYRFFQGVYETTNLFNIKNF